MKEEVERYFEKATSSLVVAKKLYGDGFFSDSCSKAYYTRSF